MSALDWGDPGLQLARRHNLRIETKAAIVLATMQLLAGEEDKTWLHEPLDTAPARLRA